MTDFEIGARYEWKYYDQAFSGVLVGTEADELHFRRDDGLPGCGPDRSWIVVAEYCDYLRRIPVPEAVVAEGDRLFDGHVCCLCGKGPVYARRTDGPHVGSKYCGRRACFYSTPEIDSEITRRRALAQPAPPASEATRYSDRHCDKCLNRAVAGATLCIEHVRSLGKPVDPYASEAPPAEPACPPGQCPGYGPADCDGSCSRLVPELCACGEIATRPDPHNPDGEDVPLEFCGACHWNEERRLASVAELDRLAAARRRHLDQLRAELDRPVKRDAADWECWSTASWESGS